MTLLARYLAQQVLDHAFSLPKSFFDRHPTSYLMARVSGDLNGVTALAGLILGVFVGILFLKRDSLVAQCTSAKRAETLRALLEKLFGTIVTAISLRLPSRAESACTGSHPSTAGSRSPAT